MFAYANQGKLAFAWDEFSHWMDSVKAMFTIDDFVTNPESNSAFRSYPPAMALFQYFFQKVRVIIWPNLVFAEDKVYFAYQVFAVSMLFPFLKQRDKCTVAKGVLSLVIIIFMPLLFYGDFYYTVYIDPIVGMLAGCGFAAILVTKDKNLLYRVYVSLICIMLVITKDIGLFFAGFISIAYMLDILIHCDYQQTQKKALIKKGMISVLPGVLALITKFSWSMEIKLSGTPVSFGGSVDLIGYVKMFFFRNDLTYKQDVVENFKNAFFIYTVPLDNLGIQFSYFNLLIVFIFLCVIIYKLERVESGINVKNITLINILGMAIIQLILYVLAIGALYVSLFTEYEALNLASYQRYINTGFMSVFIMIVLYFYDYCLNDIKREYLIYVVMTTLLLIMPVKNVFSFINNDYVIQANNIRKEYNELTNDILVNCEEKSRIYIISQENSGFDYWVVRYSVRPHIIDNAFSWSLGDPFYEGDVWTRKLSLEEWRTELIELGYDYVAIYKVNDYFLTEYSSLFVNPETIENNSLFKVNTDTGMLERVD